MGKYLLTRSFYERDRPRTSDLYSLLGACMYRTRYQVVCCTWNERLETGVRTTSTPVVQYYCCCCTYIIVIAHIPISLFNFGGVACRILFTSSANTPKSWWEGNLLFLPEGKYIFRNVFSQTLLQQNCFQRSIWTSLLLLLLSLIHI